MKLTIKIAILLVLGWPTLADAGSGTVYGRLMFFNAQGNFCPVTVTRDCTGAKYPQSQSQTNLGVSDTKVYLKNMANQIIGQGTTDAVGNYVINWFDPSSGSAVLAYVAWQLEHKDNRFAIRNGDGNVHLLTTPPAWVSVTNLGNSVFGSASMPNELANLYNGAWRSWRDSLSQSARLVLSFGNVQIRAFSGLCASSCAQGPFNMIWMNPGSAFSPQGRILHEMGHLASYKASDGGQYMQPTAAYCYPGEGVCSWGYTTPEWGAVTFEEGLANFFGDVALYAPHAPAPHTCLSAGACGDGIFNLEAGLGISCPVDSNRQPINNARYLWDVYDSVVDYPGENMSVSVAVVADAVSNLKDGFENGQKNEPYTFLQPDDHDGRSSKDFQDRWIMFGTNSMIQLLNNCGSVGD